MMVVMYRFNELGEITTLGRVLRISLATVGSSATRWTLNRRTTTSVLPNPRWSVETRQSFGRPLARASRGLSSPNLAVVVEPSELRADRPEPTFRFFFQT